MREFGEAPRRPSRIGRFVVPATIMLTFVSFWRASAIVLGDLGSSAYYVGGIAEQKIGKAAPWFVLGIMLFSYAVRAVYIESCSMFTRGGVYKVVRESMGGTAAKFSVAALMFDYVLTGPISAVSAGLYLAALLDQLAGASGLPHLPLPPPLVAATFAIGVICYFWWTNTVGVPFSSTRALRVMQVTTVMVAILVAWCLLTIALKGYQPVPPPTASNLRFSDDALGWWKGTALPGFAVIAIAIGLGHSLLAMSGEESLAQVYREIEAPKRKNLIRTGLIIFGYSLVFTALVSFFAVMLIPDDQRQHVQDNLISGIAMVLVGPRWLRLCFQGFVVAVGVLILSAAVNTSIIGSNGVLNRVAEDGVLPGWFRQPHARHGTTHRLIAMVAVLQIATVLVSRGDVTLLGEAYAFRRRLELRHEGPRRDGPALHPSRRGALARPAQRAPREPRAAGRPDADYRDAVRAGGREPVHQGSRDDRRGRLHGRLLHPVQPFGSSQQEERRRKRWRPDRRPLPPRMPARPRAR